MSVKLLFATLGLLLVTMVTARVQAETIYVDPSAPPLGTGTSWATAFKTLAPAVAAANASPPNTDIVLAAANYTPAATLVVTDECRVISHVPGGATIVSSSGASAFEIRGTNIHFYDVRFTGRDRKLYADGGQISFDGCSFSGSSSFTGSHHGAVYVENCRYLQFFDCVLDTNQSDASGGAVYAQDCEEVVILGSTFRNNKARLHGAGVALVACEQIKIYDSRFQRNQANLNGGGLYVSQGSSTSDVYMEGTRFDGNAVAAHGGGIFLNSFGDCEMVNCVVMNNVIGGDGGGIHARGMGLGLDVINCTVANNFADNGGGIWLLNWAISRSRLWNTILWDNYAFSAATALEAQCNAPPTGVRRCCIKNWGMLTSFIGIGVINTDPQLRVNGNLRISSPCIDTGRDYLCPVSHDIVGNSRVTGRQIDMGAYEWSIEGLLEGFTID